MHILAFSDIHEEEAALESLIRLSRDYDHVFACGDIARTVSFAEDLLKGIPKALVVPGNWDNERAGKVFSASHAWLQEKRVELEGGLNAVGFGYSPPTPFFTYGELSEDEIYMRMSKLPIDRNTLLLLHCPPKDHLDEAHIGRHIGSKSILRIIEEKKPLAAFFGHAHDALGVEVIWETTLVKLPPANRMRACRIVINGRKLHTEYISL